MRGAFVTSIFGLGASIAMNLWLSKCRITKQSLIEKNLISPTYGMNEDGSILINDEENICIMIGGENHLNIQVFNEGLELENTLNLAIEIEEKIGEILGYSISKKYGYLTKNIVQ